MRSRSCDAATIHEHVYRVNNPKPHLLRAVGAVVPERTRDPDVAELLLRPTGLAPYDAFVMDRLWFGVSALNVTVPVWVALPLAGQADEPVRVKGTMPFTTSDVLTFV